MTTTPPASTKAHPAARFGLWLADKIFVVFLIALFSTFVAPPLVLKVNQGAPTCDSPTGLTLMQVGPQLVDARATARVIYTDFSRQLGEEVNGFPPEAAFDANPRTVWAVKRANRTRMQTVNQPIVTLRLDFLAAKPRAELICIINGNPFDTPSYRRADRVNHYRLSTSCKTGSIQQLSDGADGSANAQQPVSSRCTSLTFLELQVIDVYAGSEIADRKADEKLKPTNNIAVGEILIYEDDPDFDSDFFAATGRFLHDIGLYD